MASQDRKFHYIWLADGTKVLDSETGINYKAYLGSLIYEYGTSQSKFKTEFENGTISFDEITGQHEVLRYFKDHLGSVRVIMQNGRPAAFNEYEPFGRFEQEYSYNKFQNVILPASKNKFMFNGKEEFYNNAKPILNFGARMYDPTIARWNSVEPLADLFHNNSTYCFCFNSPINYIDIFGLSPYAITGNEDDYMNPKDWWDFQPNVTQEEAAPIYVVATAPKRHYYDPRDSMNQKVINSYIKEGIGYVGAGTQITEDILTEISYKSTAYNITKYGNKILGWGSVGIAVYDYTQAETPQEKNEAATDITTNTITNFIPYLDIWIIIGVTSLKYTIINAWNGFYNSFQRELERAASLCA